MAALCASSHSSACSGPAVSKFPSKLCFFAALSAYLPLANEKFISEQNKNTPILMAHGDADQVVGANKVCGMRRQCQGPTEMLTKWWVQIKCVA